MKSNLTIEQKKEILSAALDSVLQAFEDTALVGGTPLDDTDFHIENAIAELSKVRRRSIQLPEFLRRSDR